MPLMLNIKLPLSSTQLNSLLNQGRKQFQKKSRCNRIGQLLASTLYIRGQINFAGKLTESSTIHRKECCSENAQSGTWNVEVREQGKSRQTKQ
jgi:hypothetical protein